MIFLKSARMSTLLAFDPLVHRMVTQMIAIFFRSARCRLPGQRKIFAFGSAFEDRHRHSGHFGAMKSHVKKALQALQVGQAAVTHARIDQDQLLEGVKLTHISRPASVILVPTRFNRLRPDSPFKCARPLSPMLVTARLKFELCEPLQVLHSGVADFGPVKEKCLEARKFLQAVQAGVGDARLL